MIGVFAVVGLMLVGEVRSTVHEVINEDQAVAFEVNTGRTKQKAQNYLRTRTLFYHLSNSSFVLASIRSFAHV